MYMVYALSRPTKNENIVLFIIGYIIIGTAAGSSLIGFRNINT